MRLRAPAAVVVAAGLLAAGAGSAAPAVRSEAIIDAARDVPGRLDLRRVGLALVDRGRRLRADVTMRRSWGTADLRAAGGLDGSVCMRLYTRRRPDRQVPDFLVCATPSPSSEDLVGSVLRERADRPPRHIGKARATRPGARTVRLRFARRLLGDDDLVGVRFGAEAVARGPGCAPPVGCRDVGPEPPDTMWLDLR